MSIPQEKYSEWLLYADPSLHEELESMSANSKEIENAFYTDLKFGTGGLRGIIGAGSNRMNIHTVARATQGLANYLNKHFKSPSVAIARDSRNMGEEFCNVAAAVLENNNIKAFLYSRIEPTPALSFAVRDLKCSAGICVTASHNPAEYNGYKVYGADGCQITTEAARTIQNEINNVGIFDVPVSEYLSIKKDYGSLIGEDTLDRFIDSCAAASLNTVQGDLNLVYTPLHGAGLECVSRILKKININSVTVEPLQSIADGNFPTCPYPNPEIKEALELGLALAEQTQADLLLATDPDTDRVGIAVVKNGKPVLLTGNEVGILLIDYICNMYEERGEDLRNKVFLTTIVSSAMADILSEDRGFELRRTLTGFKFIGEQISILESAGEVERFAFGFEESYGYLAGSHVRDKDAVVASMLICEMARWYRAKGMDLADARDFLYEKYGYYKNALISINYPGAVGSKKMASITAGLRSNQPEEIAGFKVKKVIDYNLGVAMPIIGGSGQFKEQIMPCSDVLEYQLEGNNKFIVRPSGTEPKIKAYLFAYGESDRDANKVLRLLNEAANKLLN